MANQLSRAINERVIRRLAGDAYYRRGQDYFLHGHVETLEGDGDAVRASVRGTRIYTVELTAEGGMLDYSCDCPLGVEGFQPALPSRLYRTLSVALTVF